MIHTLGADVIDVYVDAGESARNSDRPDLKLMLERLKSERDIDYVIVHKVDRLARNRGDDVSISLAIREAGAQLVSVSENIDEMPSGMLLHGIMWSIAEFYSLNLAAEVKKGTLKKVEGGTYPGFAPSATSINKICLVERNFAGSILIRNGQLSFDGLSRHTPPATTPFDNSPRSWQRKD